MFIPLRSRLITIQLAITCASYRARRRRTFVRKLEERDLARGYSEHCRALGHLRPS